MNSIIQHLGMETKICKGTMTEFLSPYNAVKGVLNGFKFKVPPQAHGLS